MIRPSSLMRKESVTLLKRTWGKDIDAGRVITSTQIVRDVSCSVQPGMATTTVDETGRWTTEVPHTVRFTDDPGLKAHDEITWVEDSPTAKSHNLIVLGTTNAAGRSVSFEVSCVERI